MVSRFQANRWENCKGDTKKGSRKVWSSRGSPGCSVFYALYLVLQGAVCSPPLTPSTFFSRQSNKVPVVQHPHHVHPLTPLITYSNEHFTPGNPPPHLPADVDPKTGRWEIVWGFKSGWIFPFCMLRGRSAVGRISHAGAPKGSM